MADTIGRVPPHNNDAEVALLGAVLLRNKALEEVQSLLVAKDFYNGAHSLIWEGITKLRNKEAKETIDLVTLTNALAQEGTLAECGGAAYIASLTNSVPASSNAPYYAQIIRNLSLKRQLLELSVDISDCAFDDSTDVKTSIDRLDQKLSELGNNLVSGNYQASGSFIFQLVEDVHKKMRGEMDSGIPSGFPSLDKYIGGFKPAEFIIIGARPSVGKTAFALSMVDNMAFLSANPVKVGFFSLEMSGQSLVERIMAREAAINSMALRNGKLDTQTDAELMRASERLYERSENLYIQDHPNIQLMEIKSQARRMVRDGGVRIIFIDYIGLINLEGAATKARHEQVAEISRSLKSLARELNIPIVCLAQVSREAGKDRPPILADLRESGSIEQDADLVMLMDDPSRRLDENNKVAQYNQEEAPDMNDRSMNSKNNKEIKIIIAKQRNGGTGGFNLLFRSNFVSFNEIEKGPSF